MKPTSGRSLPVFGVRGRSGEFEGSARLDGDNPLRSAIRLTIRAGHDRRDEHLRSGASWTGGA
jgi:polyisoprenoid-binding protein YceI